MCILHWYTVWSIICIVGLIICCPWTQANSSFVLLKLSVTALRTSECQQTNISSFTLYCNNPCIFIVYSPNYILYYTFVSIEFIRLFSMLSRSHFNDLIKKQSTHTESAHKCSPDASPVLSTVQLITLHHLYLIFVYPNIALSATQMCLAFHCTISVFKTVQEIHFPTTNSISALALDVRAPALLFTQKCQVSQLSLAMASD